jgi:hypothetical protein
MKDKEITEVIEKQREIFWHCSDLYNEINYLSTAHEKSDYHESVLLSNLFNRITGYYWSILILELSKLYSNSNNDFYRIIKVINVLVNNYKGSSWKEKISKEVLMSTQNEFSSKEFEKNLDKLKKIRDKHVAHKGYNPEKIQIHLNHEIKFFMELTAKIFDEILNPFLGTNAYLIEHPNTLENHIERYIKLQKFHEKMDEIISSSIDKKNPVLSKGTIEELQNALGRNFIIHWISDC